VEVRYSAIFQIGSEAHQASFTMNTEDLSRGKAAATWLPYLAPRLQKECSYRYSCTCLCPFMAYYEVNFTLSSYLPTHLAFYTFFYPQFAVIFVCTNLYTHTHTHTHIHIYVYISCITVECFMKIRNLKSKLEESH